MFETLVLVDLLDARLYQLQDGQDTQDGHDAHALATAIVQGEHAVEVARGIDYPYLLAGVLEKLARLRATVGDPGVAKESPAASASASAPASSEPSSESPTDDSGNGNGGEAPAGDVTAPGTNLKTGDRAVLPFRYTSDKKGATYETCSLAATKTTPVTGAEYDEGDTYSDNPVVWTN
ncbi:hypothetical protein ACFYUH_32520 [Streptomyces fimicarius]|uniref:hypothetical protein n=1 Tax=Streptomyces griseus TaxID=1911 RepID=UPI0036B8333C